MLVNQERCWIIKWNYWHLRGGLVWNVASMSLNLLSILSISYSMMNVGSQLRDEFGWLIFFLCLPFILYLVFYSHTWPRLIIEKIENVKSLRCLLRSCKEWSGWFDEVYIQSSFNFSLHHVTINLQSVSKEIPRLNSTALKNCFSWNIEHLNLWAYCINIVHTLFIWIIFFQLSFNINPQFVYKLGADYTL